jgi:hypothetical protein
MSEAVYGLLGALGGTFVSAAAAYWGPLQVQRRSAAAEAARSESARREAVAEREEARQQAERERVASAVIRESERAEAASVREHERRESEINRIISMRTTTRDWANLLARTVQDLELGRPVSISQYDTDVARIQGRAETALDHALHDGVWIRQSAYGYPAGGAGNEGQRVIAFLGEVAQLMRAAVIKGEPLEQSQAAELRRSLDRADEARGAMSSALLNHLEEVMGGVTVIEPFRSVPSPGPGDAPRTDLDGRQSALPPELWILGRTDDSGL